MKIGKRVKVLAICVCFVICLSITFGITLAFLGGKDTTSKDITLKTGIAIGAEINSSAKLTDNYVVPGQPVKITATGTINSYKGTDNVVEGLLRAKLNIGSSYITGQPATIDEGPNTGTAGGYWVKYGSYYYLVTTQGGSTLKQVSFGQTAVISGNANIPTNIGNESARKEFKANVVFEVVQAEIYNEEELIQGDNLNYYNESIQNAFKSISALQTYEREGDYIYFGTYPQTIKPTDVTVSDPNSNGYYTGSDGALYVKETAVNSGSHTNEYLYEYAQTEASDATVMQIGQDYYFRVEPLKWKILAEEDGKAKLMTDVSIQPVSYRGDIKYDSQTSTYCVVDDMGNYLLDNGQKIYANNYKHSIVREFLNTEFLDKTFTINEKNILLISEVDNSLASTGDSENMFICENTFDYAFLLSASEVMELPFNKRWGVATDYSKALGNFVYTKEYTGIESLTPTTEKAFTRTRTPSAKYSAAHYVKCNYMGSQPANYYATQNDVGIMPAIWITI